MPQKTPTARHGAKPKEIEVSYFIPILSKHVLKQSKHNWNGPRGKRILIQTVGPVLFQLKHWFFFFL